MSLPSRLGVVRELSAVEVDKDRHYGNSLKGEK